MATTVTDFLQAVRVAELVPSDILQAYVEKTDTSADAGHLAKLLVKDGHLTTFQARYLYKGKAASLVLGPYVVLEMLGKGGMGYVYKAEHRRMRRIVAVKVIAKSALTSPEAIRRFEREVQAAALLEHPNIVTAFDAGEVSGTHFLVMQFVDGKNLYQFVRTHGPQPIGIAIDWIRQAAEGFAYAHDKGVVHRDIKPGNLLIDKGGTIKILDMGLARLSSVDSSEEQLTGSDQIMGTVDYMAPEQALNTRQADARSDIYSLGATFWYLLTARPLFSGDSPMQRLMAHLQTPPPSLTAIRRDVPTHVEEFLHGMLKKEPSERFQSMRDVITALNSLPQLAVTQGRHSVRSGSAATMPKELAEFANQTTQTAVQSPPSVRADTSSLSAVEVDTQVNVQTSLHTPRATQKIAQRRSANRHRGLSPLQSVIIGSVLGVLILSGVTSFLLEETKDSLPPQEKTVASPPSLPAPSLQPTVSGSTPPTAVAPLHTALARQLQNEWARYLGCDVEQTNSIGLTMVLIPPGTITLSEFRDTPVDIPIAKPFLIGKTTVTQDQWRSVMETEPWSGQQRIGATDDTPATYVSHDEATVFCERLTWSERNAGLIRVDQAYRLPNEFEWEHACRAGTITTWSFGDDGADFGDYGWYGSGWDGVAQKPMPGGNVGADIVPQPVGGKLPNPWGLHDMHGNVWEICSNRFNEDPADPLFATTFEVGQYQVLRGGCVAEEVGASRSAIRAEVSHRTGRWDIGIRIVLSPP